MPDIYPGENYAYDDGWKRWRKPWAVVGDQWVEGKNAYVYGNGEWTHIWESTPPVLDLEIQVSHVVNDGIYVDWVAHPYADGYTLVTPNGVTAEVSSNSYRDRAPIPSVGKYTVTAYRLSGEGGAETLLTSESETVSICQAPTSFTAVRNGTRVQLQWSDDSVGFHDGFTVDAGSPISIPAGTTTYTDTTPTAGAVNVYKVKANIGALSSAWTGSESVSIEANVPTNVAVAATTTIGELKLTYSAPSSGSVTGYEVQAYNGSWVAASSNNSGATYKFSGSGSKSMHVRAKSAGGNSAYVAKSATPLWTAAPNAPTGLTAAATSTVGQLKCTWSAGATDSTHSAASSYTLEVSDNNSSWTSLGTKNSGTIHTFSGSGTKYFRVKAVNSAGSSGYASKGGTPLWAYPAPAAPSVSKFVPEGSFGRMVLTFKTGSANNSQYRVAFLVAGGSWVYGSWVNVGNNTTKSVHVGTASNTGVGGGTQTVYAFVDAKNATGQTTRSTQANYVVRGSPLVWQAAASGHHRSGRYGQDTGNPHRPYQGYHTTTSYNYDGLWYYGNNAFKNQMTTSGTHLSSAYRVPTVWQITLIRNGGQYNNSDAVYLGTTAKGTKPDQGTSSGAEHVVYDVVHVANLVYGQSVAANVPASLYNNLITGARQGFGVATGSGKPYMFFYGVNENGFSGWNHVEHIG